MNNLKKMYEFFVRISDDSDEQALPDQERILMKTMQMLTLSGVMADFMMASGDIQILGIIINAGGALNKSVIEKARVRMLEVINREMN